MNDQVLTYRIKEKSGYRTVYAFKSQYLTIQDRQYQIVGTHNDNDNLRHDLKNLETGETRVVPHKTLLGWMGIKE